MSKMEPISSDQLSIFLCHSKSDKPKVRDLYQRLRAEGIDPWLDEEKLLPGQNWELEVQKAVRSSDIVIVCLSRTAINKAGYIHKEIKYALDIADQQPENTIFLIPVKFEKCEVPERLCKWHWVDLFKDDGYNKLMNSLRKVGIDKRQKDDEIISTTNLFNLKDHENAIRTLFRRPDFPCMMSTNGLIVKNPIYNNLERDIIDKIRNDYGPNGIKNFKIMPLDLFLIKGLDENNQPLLLCYWSGKPKSGWKSYLILFRDSNKEKNITERIQNNEKDIEIFLHRRKKTVKVKKRSDDNYLVSFKIDQGYKDLVAYIFTFCDVIITGDNDDIAEREFQFNEGSYTRKFKWYYPEEMEKDERMMEVDGDVIEIVGKVPNF